MSSTCYSLKRKHNAKFKQLFFLFPEPKDPPKNVVISIIPEEVTRVKVTFTPPEEPNGNITAYYVYIFEKDKLVKNVSLNITERDQNMITAVIEGLKGGHSYSIQVDKNWQVHMWTHICLHTHIITYFRIIFWKNHGKENKYQFCSLSPNL